MPKNNLPVDPEFYTPIAVIVGSLIISLSIFLAGGVGTTIAPAVADTGTGSLLPSGTKVSLEVTDQDHIRGNSSAEVTIIEYSDLECPFCKQFHPTMQQVLSEYGDKVRWVYRHFPLDQIHSRADKEAEAAECAGEQGGNEGFWQYVDRVFEVTPSNNNLDPALLPQVAEDLGLNRSAFETCLSSGKYAQHVEDDYQSGVTAGVTGTPGSFVNGTIVRGALPFDQLKTIIDQELAR
ncbi:MAG: DsbA family protein [bacterium]|nr:DsbA family protein [bacterium]